VFGSEEKVKGKKVTGKNVKGMKVDRKWVEMRWFVWLFDLSDIDKKVKGKIIM